MIELGLQRISRLFAETPFPWRAIHVAGTNGKGSVCAYASSMLDVYNASEYRRTLQHPVLRYGRFNSPHLVDREDCISISDGDDWNFASAESSVLARNEKYSIRATEFELLAATAFEAFTQQKVDLAIVEVGMGGRLDATNILGQPTSDWLQHEANQHGAGRHANTSSHRLLDRMEQLRPQPLVTALTKIGLDHQGFLGGTIEQIAEQKAGIVKHSVPVVCDLSNPSNVLDVFRSAATRHSAQLVDWYNLEPLPKDLLEAIVPRAELPQGWTPGTPSSPRISIPTHTKSNISVAFRAVCTALMRLGHLLSDNEGNGPGSSNLQAHTSELLAQMLQIPLRTVIPGRLEYVDLNSRLGYNGELALLDGAHNAQSASVLAAEVQKLRHAAKHPPSESSSRASIMDEGRLEIGDSQSVSRPVTYMIATSSTKECTEILKPLLEPGDSLFAVEFGSIAGMPWVMPTSSSTLLDAAQPLLADFEGVLGHVSDYGVNIEAALHHACKHARSTKSPLVIAGSLYLVGDVHRLLRKYAKEDDRKVLSWSCIDDRPKWQRVDRQ